MTGDNIDSILASPHLEGFKSKGVEVLLMTDPVDDFLAATSAGEYDGKEFKSADSCGS